MSHKHWSDLTPGQRSAFVGVATAQVALAAAAWKDLARRPQERINGRKPLWAMAIAVNFIGPIAYLIFGRAKVPTREDQG